MTALTASFSTVARPKFGGTSATSVSRGRPVAASMRSTRSRAGVGELGIALKALGDEHVVALGGLLDPEAGHATVQELDPERRQGARLEVGEVAPHEPYVAQGDRGKCAAGKRDPVQHAALDGEAGLRQAVPLQLADRAAGNRDLRTTEEVVATRDGRIDGQVGSASISEFLPRLAASHRARV